MTTREKTREWLESLKTSLDDGSFVAANLGAYRGSEPDLKGLLAKRVVVKRGEKLSLTFRHKTRDIIKNFDLDDGLRLLETALAGDFGSATLKSTQFDLLLDNGAKQVLKRSAPTVTEAPGAGHDHAKARLVPAAKPYLEALGVTDAKGNVLKSAQDKFRQINRYVEILSSHLKAIPPERLRRVVDMGSGKGYLTFALYDYLASTLGVQAHVTGVEFRADMVALCNGIAQASGFAGLDFVQGRIEDFDSTGADVLIALHACDTATDDAIAKGIAAEAELIVAAPCCHKQIRREIEAGRAENELDALLRHGIFLERQAEMVTDALRALILDYFGYGTKVFEFISDQHTPKNVMIIGTRQARPVRDKAAILEKIRATKAYFGIRSHHLEQLVGI